MPVLHHILDGRLGEALLAHRLLEHLELRLRHRRCCSSATRCVSPTPPMCNRHRRQQHTRHCRRARARNPPSRDEQRHQAGRALTETQSAQGTTWMHGAPDPTIHQHTHDSYTCSSTCGAHSDACRRTSRGKLEAAREHG